MIIIDPIYKISTMVFNMLGGAIVLDEQDLYTWEEFMILMGCAAICMIGVFIMIKIPKQNADEGKINTFEE